MNANDVRGFDELGVGLTRLLAEQGRETFIKETASTCSRQPVCAQETAYFFAASLAILDRQSWLAFFDPSLTIEDRFYQITKIGLAGLYFLNESGVIITSSIGVNKPGERFQESRSTAFWIHLIEKGAERFKLVYAAIERMSCR